MTMSIIKILIPVTLVILGLLLIKYDKNKNLKDKHISWISKHVFNDNSGLNSSAFRLHQTILSFIFIFCVGIAALFVVGIFEK